LLDGCYLRETRPYCRLLQRQLQLGIELSEMVELTDLGETAKQCLARDEGWIAYYQTNIEAIQAQSAPVEDLDRVLVMSRAEVSFGHAFWERDLEGAAKVLEARLESTFEASRPTGAWHALWLGYCYDLLGDHDRARLLYARAHGAERNIPAFDRRLVPDEVEGVPPQVLAVADLLRTANSAHLQLPRHFDRDLAALDGLGEVSRIEGALESLGTFLGLRTSRPDSELGTGPDVVWSVEVGPALSIEAKTAKGTQAMYSKRDLGQVRDHRQWVVDELNPDGVFSTFVGPVVPAASDANPDPDITVVELAEFHGLGERL
jgi:tetratricopeptide (TPR) repeat protein